jgi:hypothetical protein
VDRTSHVCSLSIRNSPEPWAALALHARGVPFGTVQNAFVLATARRAFRSDANRLDPVRALRYFLPVVQEIVQEPPLPEYLDYLRLRLREAGIHIP